MAKKPNDYGTGIPRHEVEALARCFLPDICSFFASEQGKQEFAEWKERQQPHRKGNEEHFNSILS